MAINIAFLWHFHQPYYKDPYLGTYSLPWVRLHSIKGYYDMIAILEKFPNIKLNFNITPSLLIQLKDYEEDAKDLFYEFTVKHPHEMSVEEKVFILSHFFSANWDNMIKPYPEYFRLLEKRGFKIPTVDLDMVAQEFSNQEILDLQVWFNLAWFGFMAREKYNEIDALIHKGRLFNENDKSVVLSLQREIIKEIIPQYKKYFEKKQIEISTSPFYHPILPLIYDTQIAKRSLPHLKSIPEFKYPQDVHSQVDLAISLYQSIFGVKPKGMWPSEGSVAPEIIPILKEKGIEWIATCEGILSNSIPIKSKLDSLYKPYKASYKDIEINIIFRDREISDSISFIYGKTDPKFAINDIRNKLKNVSKSSYKNPLVCIILDGENPWEYYPNSGREFIYNLYDMISNEKEFRTVLISEYLEEYPSTEVIKNLYSGSWINSNFGIWIGSTDDRKAWSALSEARRIVENYKDIPHEKKNEIMNEIYIAEGSDWFWWYGEEFPSEYTKEFDRLFRSHLMRIYNILGIEVPQNLQKPIFTEHKIVSSREPSGFINPTIDGKITDFYEWYYSGYYNAMADVMTMHRIKKIISGIFYGFNLENLFIRIDPNKEEKGVKISIKLEMKEKLYELIFDFEKNVNAFSIFENGNKIGELNTIAFKKIIELSIPFSILNLPKNEEIKMSIELEKNKSIIEKYPIANYISFFRPDESFEKSLWRI